MQIITHTYTCSGTTDKMNKQKDPGASGATIG